MMRGLLPTKRNEDFERLLVRLRNKWQPLVRPAQDLQCQKLEIDHSHIKWGGATRRTSLPGDSESLTNGEIFRVEEGIVIVTLGEEDTGGRLRFKEDGKGGIIAVEPDEGDTLKVEVSALVHAGELEVLDIVSEAALEDLEITLEPYRYENSRFAEIKGDVVAEELPSNQTHVMAARALLSRTARTLAVAVKSARGILARDAQRHVPDGVDAAPIWDSLITAGVLERDVVIVCNTTREQIARVPDKATLKDLARVRLRCACGRPIEEEQPEMLYTITDIGRVLLDKSRWMSVLVQNELTTLGVPTDDIILECQIGSDEIDCIAQISGEIAIFELKDKDFSIGNAYSFGAKMSIFKVEHAVIVTTEGISPDVKEHFNRTRESGRRGRFSYIGSDTEQIHYVEGADFLDSLGPIIGAIYAKDGGRILDRALALGTANSQSLISAL